MNSFESRDAEHLHGYLAAIVESSDDAIISKTLDGIITSWNAAATRIFGYTPEDAIGQSIYLIIPKDREDEEFVILGKVKAGQKLEHFETVRRRKDGSFVDLSLTVSPIRDDDGKIVGVCKIARDIGIIKEAERLGAYMAAIVESSDDAIIAKNLDGTITSWNGAAMRIFGYTPEEAIGQHISLIIPHDKIDEEYTILAKVKSGERVDHFETVRRSKNDDKLEISLTVSPIRDHAGRIIGASKVARNITVQKRTETLLRETNRRKDEFLANMSHELRTPMNAVMGLSHIIGMSQNLSPKEQKCVSMLKQSSENLLALINNLLDFSRLETDAVELEEVEFNLTEVIENPVMLLEVKVQEKNLKLAISYDDNVKDRYIGDPLRLQQIVTNLVANAIKFTERGEIEIGVRVAREMLKDTVLVFEVSDTGVGIPEDKLTAIFDKFTQADASTTRKYGGSGLGLSICKALAEAMDGSISVVSRVGIGSTFTVEVKLKNAVKQAPIVMKQVTAERMRKNVLVVEDYEPNVLVVTTLLEHLGYDYDVALNGLEALRKAERGIFDVILMDVQMPGMDGFESTRLIREHEESHSLTPTPIVAMTAHVLDHDKNLCFEAGMNDFIPKPFAPSLLEKVLAQYIGGPDGREAVMAPA